MMMYDYTISYNRTHGWEAAIRGMRNSHMSHEKSDSYFDEDGNFVMGPNDLALAGALCRKGSSHRKFLRMIHFTADIEASMSFWHDFDTYKVGTVVNSESRVAWLRNHEITKEKLGFMRYDFVDEGLDPYIEYLNKIQKEWVEEVHPDKKLYHFNVLTRLLPAGYRQLRTIDLTYETLFSIYKERRGHVLIEFRRFCRDISRLPYAKELIVEPICGEKGGESSHMREENGSKIE